MSSGQKACAQDEEDYENLCRYFGVKEEGSCYGAHQALLKRLREKERHAQSVLDGIHQENLSTLRLRTTAMAKLTPAEKKALDL